MNESWTFLKQVGEIESTTKTPPNGALFWPGRVLLKGLAGDDPWVAVSRIGQELVRPLMGPLRKIIYGAIPGPSACAVQGISTTATR